MNSERHPNSSKILCVTNRHLCLENFQVRIQKITRLNPFAIILREKDLSQDDYSVLLNTIIPLSEEFNVPLFVHTHLELAIKNNLGLQVSFQQYKEMSEIAVPLGISIHSREEAQYIANDSKKLNISHIIVGHIFETDCKKDLMPRGVDLLSQISNIFKPLLLPVYGIGGITPIRMPEIMATGANGAALMSSLMNCKNPMELMESFFTVSLE